MSEGVCCPNCWTWTYAARSSACRRCGAPLLHADGRRVDDAPPPPTPAHWAFQTAEQMMTLPQPPPLQPAPPPLTVSTALLPRDIDWVRAAKLITIVYGAVTTLGILGFGLIVRHITLPGTDPITGWTVDQTYDIGAVFVVVAIIVAVVFGVFAWLTEYTAARVAFLLLDTIAVLLALTNLAGQSLGLLAVSVAALLVDLAYGFVMVMSLVELRPAKVVVLARGSR